MKTSDELYDLILILKQCEKITEKLVQSQEYEKATKYKALSKNTIKLINYVSGTANELKSEEQKRKETADKISRVIIEGSTYTMK